MKIGYAWVSTFEQNLDMQMDAMIKDGGYHVVTGITY